MLHRRRLITLAAPALIVGRDALAQPIPTTLNGFPTAYNPRAWPPTYPSQARRWNSVHPLARGLQFGLVMGSPAMAAYDFVNNIEWYNQNSGITRAVIPGLSIGYAARFTSASSGYTIPTVGEPSAILDAAYQMLGAMSLVYVGCWPVGASSTGTTQTLWTSGSNASDYNCSVAFTIADKMAVYRAGNSGGGNWFNAEDQSAGGAANYQYSRMTTFGVSQNGQLASGSAATKFYREGKDTGNATVTHYGTGTIPAVTQSYQLGRYVGSITGQYVNGIGSMLYGWNRVLSDAEFAWVEQDKWWALRVPGQPLVAPAAIASAAVLGRPRGIILP